MDKNTVLTHWIQDNGVAYIELNRPDARNALNLELRQRLADVFFELDKHQSVRCIVLTGGDQVFAAGADLNDFSTATTTEMYLKHTEQYWHAISHCSKPIIAAVNGFALGGGCELAMHADIIIAGESAKFGQPEVKLGLMPGAGGTQRLLRAIGKFKTMLFVLSGQMISAKKAEQMGLVSEVVADEQTIQQLVRV